MSLCKARIEWRTLLLILVTYGFWGAAGGIIWPVYPVFALSVLCVLTAFHGSLVHEVCHGHPTRHTGVNELLVSVPLGMIWPYRRFKALHLQHHANERLTDPFEDPESYYLALYRAEGMPRWLRFVLEANNTMVGRAIVGPVLGTIALLRMDFGAICRGNAKVRRAWALHVVGLIPVIGALVGFGIPIWLYFLVVVWGSLALLSVRTFAEHRWHENADGRSIVVERSPLSLLFLNNNLHVVHHDHPHAPWYELPRLYRAARSEWYTRNGGYVYRNYWQLFRAYAFRTKEPLAHPAWYRNQR
jgi:fatty acid desaturase